MKNIILLTLTIISIVFGNSNRWHINFKWSNDIDGSDSYYYKISCGYNNKFKSEKLGMMPPSFVKIEAGVCDLKTQRIGGYYIHNNDSAALVYVIKFVNNYNRIAKINYKLTDLNALPDGYIAKTYNIDTKTYDTTNISSFELSGKSTAYKILVMTKYNDFNDVKKKYDNILNRKPNKKKKIKTVYKNNKISIDVNSVDAKDITKLSIYNMTGKMIICTTKKSINNINLSSGMYLVIIKINKNNMITKISNKIKITK